MFGSIGFQSNEIKSSTSSSLDHMSVTSNSDMQACLQIGMAREVSLELDFDWFLLFTDSFIFVFVLPMMCWKFSNHWNVFWKFSLCTIKDSLSGSNLKKQTFCFWTNSSSSNVEMLREKSSNKFTECGMCTGRSCTTHFPPLRAWQISKTWPAVHHSWTERSDDIHSGA